MRFWGWGREGHPRVLPEHALAFLAEHVGVSPLRAPVELAQVALPASRLPAAAEQALQAALGPDAVAADHRTRVLHCGGKGYPDLVRLRAGRPELAPDAVAWPRDAAAVRAALRACADHDVAVVPFGGGTSVVGGLSPERGSHQAVVSLDLRAVDAIGEVDRESLLVRCGAGVRVAALEAHLGATGLTLGHYPQSYEYVTVGGCAATRSAGQASSGYGRFDEMVAGLRFLSPGGELDLAAVPASAAGPDLRELVLGSEGALGVITEVTLGLRPAPAVRRYEGVFFETFAGGADALRALAALDGRPDVIRLSDEPETRMSIALSGSHGPLDALARGYLRLRGVQAGCLAIIGFEGGDADVRRRRARAAALLRRHGAVPVGGSPGRAWEEGRFTGPYLRDDLLDHGVMVETLETAAPWRELPPLRRAVADAIASALRARGTPGLVMCHVSHVYRTGASLYFTFLARQQEGSELEQWRAVKEAAGAAIVAHRATITHHHGVGRDHRGYLTAEIGRTGVAALLALKRELDPAAVMNPGALLPPAEAQPADPS
jgi:alkyldihydroxyacetonephosphate synthase